MSIPAFPLSWPAGWKRTHVRASARFKTKARGTMARSVSVYDGVARVRLELERMGVSDNDLVVSTNVALRLDGWPRSDQPEPKDPGAAVYWLDSIGNTRCMAIDRYDRVADNLAAIAATLEAMRAIERHGGAEILDRAFAGFAALPAPERHWSEVLGFLPGSIASLDDARAAYHRLRSKTHPDKGGDAQAFDEVEKAWTQAQAQLA